MVRQLRALAANSGADNLSQPSAPLAAASASASSVLAPYRHAPQNGSQPQQQSQFVTLPPKLNHTNSAAGGQSSKVDETMYCKTSPVPLYWPDPAAQPTPKSACKVGPTVPIPSSTHRRYSDHQQSLQSAGIQDDHFSLDWLGSPTVLLGTILGEGKIFNGLEVGCTRIDRCAPERTCTVEGLRVGKQEPRPRPAPPCIFNEAVS